MAEDPNTDVVIGYVEGLRDPEKLEAALAIVRRAGKPVVMMKVGRSEVGAIAAKAHAAAIAGSDAAFDALLDEYGVFRARTIAEMFDIAYAATFGKFPATPDLGVISLSGGVGVTIADAAEDAGFTLPALPEATQQRLRELVSFAGTRNPVDVTAQFINDPGLLQPMFEALMDDGDYATAICFLASVGLSQAMMERMLPQLQAIGRKYPDRPLILSTQSNAESRPLFEEAGFMVFEDPSHAIRAAEALLFFGRARQDRTADDAG